MYVRLQLCKYERERVVTNLSSGRDDRLFGQDRLDLGILAILDQRHERVEEKLLRQRRTKHQNHLSVTMTTGSFVRICQCYLSHVIYIIYSIYIAYKLSLSAPKRQ